MYTRKPKNITKFLTDIQVAHALHTWQYADDARLKQIGSTASPLSVEKRKQREKNRRVISAYRDSKIASVASRSRRDVKEFTLRERKKLQARIDKQHTGMKRETSKSETPSLQQRPLPDASLYRRSHF